MKYFFYNLITKVLFFIFIAISLNNLCFANSDINRIFPIENYNQDLNFWFNSSNKDYKTLRLSKETQRQYFNVLKSNYYGKNSPWSSSYINYLLKPEPKTGKTIYNGIQFIIDIYNTNTNKPEAANTLYGMNFKQISNKLIQDIAGNINLTQFKNLRYLTQNRAIATDNVIIRALPTFDPAFNSYKIAGSGYPFDLLNLSYITTGTPVYIIGTSKDLSWYFIVAPAMMGWVPAKNIARVNSSFVNNWQTFTNKALAGILTSNLTIKDTNNNYQFTALVGTMLPVYKQYKNSFTLMIPVKNSAGQAIIKYTTITKKNAVLLPMPLTMENFSNAIKYLIGKPYGWGGINFYNDCSLELITIYKMFGIFLNRNSAAQASYSGQMIDVSGLPAEKRLEMVIRNGIPFATFLYLKGHIMIYIGTYNTAYGENTVMTYHNIWGLAPEDRTWRDIIGGSVILPLLKEYPEVPQDIALYNRDVFIITTLVQPNYNKIGLSNLLY